METTNWEKLGICMPYIEIEEKTKEEQITEFIETIECAIENFNKKKYGVSNFVDIINVACNMVSTIFGGKTRDCLISPSYLVYPDQKKSIKFFNNVKSHLKKYKENEISIQEFYQLIEQECDLISTKDKSKQKTLKPNTH